MGGCKIESMRLEQWEWQGDWGRNAANKLDRLEVRGTLKRAQQRLELVRLKGIGAGSWSDLRSVHEDGRGKKVPPTTASAAFQRGSHVMIVPSEALAFVGMFKQPQSVFEIDCVDGMLFVALQWWLSGSRINHNNVIFTLGLEDGKLGCRC